MIIVFPLFWNLNCDPTVLCTDRINTRLFSPLNFFTLWLSNRSLLRQKKEETWPIGSEHSAIWSAQPKQKMEFGKYSKWPLERRYRHAGERRTADAFCCECSAMDFIPVLGLQKCVSEGHTSVYSVIHPPHIRQKLWERVPSDKKSFVFVCFFLLFIF